MQLGKIDKADKPSFADLPRRQLVEKAVYSIPTSDLKGIMSRSQEATDSRIPPASSMSDVASGKSLPDAGAIVSCRVAFPDLVVNKEKERAFIQELSDQIRVALAGIGNEPLAASCLSRQSDEEAVVVQLSLPLYRGEQLKSLLAAPALLSYTPLLKFGKFDEQYWANSSGLRKAYEDAGLAYPAASVLSRLDEMEKRYQDIKERRNIIESFHEIMRKTNPYIQRMEALKMIEEPRVPFPGEDVPDQAPPAPTFPWTGVPGVLSPRAKEPPRTDDPSSYKTIIDPSAPDSGDAGGPLVRIGPPPATSVVAKNALDLALQQLSVDGVQLSAASSEISRRIEEAAEHAELTRIAAAGLVSPQVLERLVAQSTLKREQARQKDELAVLKAWEQDNLASVERDNTMLYMERLFALATGDDDALAELTSGDKVIISPEELRAKKEQIMKHAIQQAVPKQSSPGDKIPVTVHVVRGSNLPSNADCFVRLRVVNKRGTAETETQTSTVPGGDWEEKLFIEFKASTKTSGGFLEMLLFQYNSTGRDVLLAQASIPLSQVRDTDSQAGVWILNPSSPDITSSPSISLRFDMDTGDSVTGSNYKIGLQSTLNLLRERNMDFIADQVERVEEERRRLENRVRDLDGEISPPLNTLFGTERGYVQTLPGGNLVDGSGSVHQIPGNLFVQQDPNSVRNSARVGMAPSGLREVEKPLPSYESVYSELVELVKKGQLQSAEGRQLAYDFSYLGQTKTDFGQDKKLFEYLSMQSDICAKFLGDFPIQIAALCSLSNMLVSVSDNVGKKRQVSLVVWEAAYRNLALADQDQYLGDQILTALALIVQPPRTGTELIDFCLTIFQRARELIQIEQIMQVLSYCKAVYRKSEQIQLVLSVIERFRFNEKTVERALTCLAMLYGLDSDTGGSHVDKPNTIGGIAIHKSRRDSVDKKFGDTAVELVVVAAGMYADSASVQIAAIEVLTGMAALFTDRVETIIGPVVIDQSLDRNKTNTQVQLGVARLLLRLADLKKENEFDVPEAIPTMISMIAASQKTTDQAAITNTDLVLVCLAAIRACFSSARNKERLVFAVSDTTLGDFVSVIEKSLALDASIAREACLTIEAVLMSPDMRDSLVKAGVVSIPLTALQTTHSIEYPKMTKTFLSCLHALISTRSAAFQLARLDGVQVLLNSALYSQTTEWRSIAILCDACAVEETRNQFKPNEDIERLIAHFDKCNQNNDIESILQSVRLIGEISFYSSFSIKDLFRKVNEPLNVLIGSGTVNFAIQPTIWALLNKRLPAKGQDRLERLTTPSGKDLTNGLPDNIIKDYNVWVTSQGGAEAGASIAGRAGAAKAKAGKSGGGGATSTNGGGGFLNSLTGLFGAAKTDELEE